ncbi:unnamed protein product [Parajaminaea phylloscopi]
MPFVHVVLLKVKADIWEAGNGKDELVQKLEGLRELPIVKELKPELAWGPPVYADRAKGFNYGLYTKFTSQAEFERYRDDAGHRDLVKTLVVPNTDEVMAFDLEY